MFYGYLNLESTKTKIPIFLAINQFYGYLNLESTKTGELAPDKALSVLRLLKS